MKTFLKVLLLAALLIVAIKLSPVIFVGAMLGLIAAVVLGAVGLSLVAVLVAVVATGSVLLVGLGAALWCYKRRMRIQNHPGTEPLLASDSTSLQLS